MMSNLFILTGYVSGQTRPATGLWTAAAIQFKFSPKWQWNNDAGYRTFSWTIHPLQYLYRSGVRFTINQNWNTAAGIAFFFTKSDFNKSHHEFGHEFRLWQEGVYQHLLDKSSSVNFLLRLRTEERFFAATTIKDKYTGYRFRFRPGLNKRLNEKWSLQLTNEYMRQLANQKFSFDQNRVTVSAIHEFNSTTQLQTSYIWLKWPTSDQHIVSLTFTKIIPVHGS